MRFLFHVGSLRFPFRSVSTTTSTASKMPLKLAANISTMFKDGDISSRYELARELGFKAVECQFPYDVPMEKLRSRKLDCNVEHVLINSYPGKLSTGELGFAAKPGCEAEFLSSLETTIKYAKALDCKKVHVMAGVMSKDRDKAMEETYIKNLQKAAEMLEKENIIGVIEPLCKQVKPYYFLDSYKEGARFVAQVNHSNMRLLLDVFHLQMLSGNLTNTIRELFPLVGHIQISQAPSRCEPSAPGEINYPYILNLIDELGYADWIGLEYFPSGSALDSIRWITDYNCSL